MDIIIGIVFFCISCLLGYLTAYSKKKGENRALTEDIAILTEEKQKVISQYEIRLEEQKKLHSLEIEKRKYKYEEKVKQFTLYFKLLDEFNRKNRESIEIEIIPNIGSFMKNIYENPKNGKPIEELMNRFLEGDKKIDEEHVRMRNETSNLRLISSPEMEKLLDGLDKLLEESCDVSKGIMKDFSDSEQFLNPESAKPDMDKVNELDKRLKKKRQQLMDLMKQELDEI